MDLTSDDAAMNLMPDDVLEAAAVARNALEAFADQDWAIRAGDLTWDIRTTLMHTADAVGWYAAHLAVQSRGRLRFDFRTHDDAPNTELLEVLHAAAAMLAQVARAAPPGARGYHPVGLADASGFLAMGCDEILVHCWDAARGLGLEFVAPTNLADRVPGRLFPWAPRGETAWQTLLWANGRTDLRGQPGRPGPDWQWHCAPLDEWDGTIPHSHDCRPAP
jgi:hypothetical protein